MAQVTLGGNPVNVSGNYPKPGDTAPDFTLTGKDLKEVSLKEFQGRRKVLNIVPSLDTGVCAMSTKKFNDAAAKHADTVFLIISADLPFAQGRFCQAENTKAVKTLSMMRSRNFAKDYGVLITDGPLAGITARAVVVLDANNNVVYSQLVPEIAQEPNYDAALTALK